MLNLIKKILGIRPPIDFRSLVAQKAQIIDVRSAPEFAGGHVQGALNIPLQELGNSLYKVSRTNPIIVCCASGVRSEVGVSLLKSKGFKNVYNGGGWKSLRAVLKNK